MLVHHVDHPIAGSPKEKQRADENESEEKAFAFGGDEHALFTGIHFLRKGAGLGHGAGSEGRQMRRVEKEAEAFQRVGRMATEFHLEREGTGHGFFREWRYLAKA
jgi:hypothetical protein